MSEAYEVVLPAGNSEIFAKELLKQMRDEGWAAYLRKVNLDAVPIADSE